MFRWFSITALTFLLLASAAWGEDRNTMPSLNQAIRAQWLQFSIVGGRINLDCSRVGNLQNKSSSLSQKDQFTLRTENGETAVTYEWSNAKEQLAIEVSGGSVHLRRGPKNDAAESTVEFTQKPREKSVLSVAAGGKQEVFAAEGLWHLFILYPEESRKYLSPLLQTLQPKWKLNEQADALETELLRNTENALAFDRSNWMHWVAQLGDENYARREAADRALRSANRTVLIFLQQLDFNQLDAEQQFRLRRIIEAMSLKISSDSPEQVASWLSGDASIWLALLSRPEVAARRVAAKQLTAFLESPISVDPEAAPASQKTQFEQLRARIESLSGLEKK